MGGCSNAPGNPVKTMTRKIAECTLEELHFCKLRARGNDQTTAFRIAFNKHSMTQKTATQSASRVAARPQVLLALRDLFMEAKKSTLLSHAQWLDMMISAFHESMAEGNRTAAASFGRLMGQGIGSLSEVSRLEDQRMTDEQLIERLGQSDPAVAQAITRLVGGRKTFH